MKKVISLFICTLSFHIAFTQQDKQLTHYMFDRMSFNPAITGLKGVCGTFIYRNQWDRVQDAPNTTLLNLQGRIPRTPLGVGLSLANDAIGFQRNNQAVANIAYHLQTMYGTLSGGLGVGLINIGFSPDWVPPQTYQDPLLPDPTAGTAFDVNAGLYWHGTTAPYYIGISSTHLAPPTLKNINYSVARHYYVLAGYDLTLNTANKMQIKPSVLIKVDGATAIFDLNATADYWINNYSNVWGGLTYRMQDAVAINVGYAISPAHSTYVNMFKVGYSFDIMTNPLNPYGRGTHELMLNFCIFPPERGISGFGNPFILE